MSVAKLCSDNLITVQFNDLDALFFRSEIIAPSFLPTQTRSSLKISDHSLINSKNLDISYSKLINQTQSFAEKTQRTMTNSNYRSMNFAKLIFYVPHSVDFLFSFRINKYHCDKISMSSIVDSLPWTHIPENMC